MGYLGGTATNLAGRAQYHFTGKRVGDVVQNSFRRTSNCGRCHLLRRPCSISSIGIQYHLTGERVGGDVQFLSDVRPIADMSLVVTALLDLFHRTIISFDGGESRGFHLWTCNSSVATALLSFLHRDIVMC